MHRNTRPKKPAIANPNEVRCACCTLPVLIENGEPKHTHDRRDGELFFHGRCWLIETRHLGTFDLAVA